MNHLSRSFVQTLKEAIPEIAIEMSEISLDIVLEDGLLKQIPVFKYLYLGKKLINDTRDFYFLRKLTEFLNEIAEIPVNERIEFWENNSIDEEIIGDSLIMILDRIDSVDKARLIARLFRSLVHGKINIELFNRLCLIVERTYIRDLHYLKEQIHVNDLTGFGGMSLANNGLAIRYTYDAGTWGGTNEVEDDSDIRYRVTKLGRTLVEVLFT